MQIAPILCVVSLGLEQGLEHLWNNSYVIMDLDYLEESLEHLEYIAGLNEIAEGEELLELDLETARKKRSCWTKDWIAKRAERNKLYDELIQEDENKFRQAFR